MPTLHLIRAATVRRPLLNERQVAEFFNCSVKVVQKWRQNGKGPPWERIGPSMVRYDPDRLDEWRSEGAGAPDARQEHLRLIVAARQNIGSENS